MGLLCIGAGGEAAQGWMWALGPGAGAGSLVAGSAQADRVTLGLHLQHAELSDLAALPR